MSKNSFDINGNTISITKQQWNFTAYATIREDYVDEIQSVTWGLSNGRYLYNEKYGYLHSYIMKKWYGEDLCEKMKEDGYVIDHIDNISSNCCINNLCFLQNSYNKAKGWTFDIENIDKSHIALTIFKNFETQLFQITIVFNYPATLHAEGFNEPSIIEIAYLLYEDNYKKVLNDAQSILLEYKEKYTFSPETVKAIDYHIEGHVGRVCSPEVYEEYLNGDHGHCIAFFSKKSPLVNWTKDIHEKYFVITDSAKKCSYKLKL